METQIARKRLMPVVNLLFVDNKLYALDTKFDNKMHNFNLNLLFVDNSFNNKLYALDTKFDNKMHNFNLNFYL
uniref:Uncharacterized protein n=2 Tax=Lymantria dispar multicapsid nuclear polyhedrosis virus TaxID=10449 RepID=A0A0A0YUY7_NPVLD|nr:hypothetical protein [Lymantria dispar multiple nucleopolyhedrovirus]